MSLSLNCSGTTFHSLKKGPYSILWDSLGAGKNRVLNETKGSKYQVGVLDSTGTLYLCNFWWDMEPPCALDAMCPLAEKRMSEKNVCI